MNSRDFDNTDAYRSRSAAAATTPAACPACHSSSITTTARKPDENTYWRCDGCGEVWNASRRSSGPSGGHRWR
jgi:transposase-like protein